MSRFREFHAPTVGAVATMVDTSYDFRREIPLNADPDHASVTLRRYHQLLWSKQTPSLADLRLADRQDGSFLYPGYSSEATGGEVTWSSDAIVNSWIHWTRPSMADIIRTVSADLIDEYYACAYTIGSYMMWPRNRIGGDTINQARGKNTAEIADRIDLTLECVRLYYTGRASPLNDDDDRTLDRYADFFRLFVDFKGFVDFWLLHDLVSNDYLRVDFLAPFQSFSQPAVPIDVDAWTRFTRASMAFCTARNARIHEWAVQNLSVGSAAESPGGDEGPRTD
jgi:hypothetical protein